MNKTLTQVEQITGVALSEVYVDKGYRGHDYTGDAKVPVASGGSSKRLTRVQRKRRQRRNAIEPIDRTRQA